MAPAAPHGKPRCIINTRITRAACVVLPRGQEGVGRAGAGPRGGPGAQRPGAPRGAPRHSCHALPRACTPGGPCHPSPMAPAAPHGKPPQNGHPEEEEEEEEGGFIDCL